MVKVKVKVKAKKTQKVYKNIDALLDGKTCYEFGRMLYDNIACGPWVSFIQQVSSSKITYESVDFTNKNGITYCPCYGFRSSEVQRFVNFKDNNGKPKSWRSFKAMVKKFKDSHKDGAVENASIPNCSIEINKNEIIIVAKVITPEFTKDLYYADKDVKNQVHINNCIGINLGSIVEGSDAEIGPYRLDFPFTDKELWDTLHNINSEASEAFEEANMEEVIE